MNRQPSPALPASLEARLAARMAGALSLNAQALPHDVSERLRFAREKALAKAREGHRPVLAGVSAQGAAVLSDGPGWQRLAAFVPLLLLVAGLVAIDHWLTHEQVLTAADIDAQILADDLPPAAFSDPGFVEFLRSPPPQP